MGARPLRLGLRRGPRRDREHDPPARESSGTSSSAGVEKKPPNDLQDQGRGPDPPVRQHRDQEQHRALPLPEPHGELQHPVASSGPSGCAPRRRGRPSACTGSRPRSCRRRPPPVGHRAGAAPRRAGERRRGAGEERRGRLGRGADALRPVPGRPRGGGGGGAREVRELPEADRPAGFAASSPRRAARPWTSASRRRTARSASRRRSSSDAVEARLFLPPFASPLLGWPAARPQAWTSPLMEALNRDARKLLPRSLRRLLAEREAQILEEMRRFPPAVSPGPRRRPQRRADLGRRPRRPARPKPSAVVELLKKQRLTEGLVRLGGLLRVPADLSDPVLAVGPEGYPPGVTREYYAFVEGNLAKIPVVLDDPRGPEARAQGPARLLAGAARPQPRAVRDVIRTEMFQDGRVVDHKNARLSLAGLRRGLALLLAGGQRHRRHLARGLARGPRRHHAACPSPARCDPRDAPARPWPSLLSPHRGTPTMNGSARSSPCTARTASWTSPASSSRAATRSSPPAAPRPSCQKGKVAGHRGLEGHRLPGDPRRPGEDAAPEDPRRHPRAARRCAEHEKALAEHGIAPIDVVVVNLYPFEDKVAKGAPFDEASRTSTSAAPPCCARRPRTSATWRWWWTPPTTACSSSSSTARTASTPPPGSTSRRRPSATPRATRPPSPATSPRWRSRDEGYAVAETDDVFPYRLSLTFEKVQDLRYGENPHQRAAFYSDLGSTLYSVAAARKVQGKELSFNNILDLDAAWRLVTELPRSRLRDHQAHEPLRHRPRRESARGLEARLGVRSHLGLRRASWPSTARWTRPPPRRSPASSWRR